MVLLISTAVPAASRENSTELYQKGARLALDGQIDKAILVFQRVVEISPYYCMGHYGLGKAYLYKYGMLDDAIKHLRKSVTLDRKLTKGYYYLGTAYFMAQKYPLAIHAYKSAYHNDETYIEALYNLGVVYEIMEKSYESKLYFSRFLSERTREDEDIFF
ncbi:MAG: hypothetical protein E4G96_00015 [Chrysiogenales bacterium]|nr:MAG: hypothetical protein E4G96_00015 [Chrysiogenales bacterium]